jgi:hypothetical protein
VLALYGPCHDITPEQASPPEQPQAEAPPPHTNGETMKNKTIIVAYLILISSCTTQFVPNAVSTTTEINLPSLQNIGMATPLQITSITPIRTDSNEINLSIKIARNGQNESINVETQALPNGLTSTNTTIAPQEQQGTITLRGMVTAETTITVQLRSNTFKLERTINLKSVAPIQQGGTHRQSLHLGTSNLEPNAFAAMRIYANFKGSTCQVMVQGRGHALYICFNGPLRVGQVYPLSPSRGLNNDTASITYFQSTTEKGRPTGFWDSRSGFLSLKTLNKDRIELLLQEVKFEPAKDFLNNAARGEFGLEASTQIEDISNLPQ